jgi:hypothetical protein
MFEGRKILASLARIESSLERIEAKLGIIQKEEETIMQDLTQLTADVANDTTVEKSAVTLLQGLKARLDAAIAADQSGDPQQLAALSRQLEASTADLAAAITANTPAAPAAATS